MALSAGFRLGPYGLVHLLGAGGMGEVYRARDLRLGRDVAIKILSPGFSADPHALERSHREARAISSLAHPNICTVYEIGEHNGRREKALQLDYLDSHQEQRYGRRVVVLEYEVHGTILARE